VSLKYRLGFDDSLDVVGVHFVGGWIGSLWIGLFATSEVTGLITDGGPSNGLFTGGGLTQLGRQALGSGIVSVYSFAVAFAIGWLIEKTIGFRATPEAEVEGIDVAEHAESGYELSPTAGGAGAFALAGVGAPTGTSPPAEAPDTAKVAG
jgi:Amt family ammonium transporter